MVIFLVLLLMCGLTVLTLLCCYLWVLAFLSLFKKKEALPRGERGCRTRFAFVVPAHNEEAGIASTIRSLMSVNYPPELVTVFVVADNCTDNTAAIAKREGAVCLERSDLHRKGKGYALQFAFETVLLRNYDAVVVIDADSVVEQHFLVGLDARVSAGQHVVQVYDGLSNPEASVLTYLFQVGNVIENRMFWVPKEQIGLPVLLRGNGMCFSREILTKYPWASFSIVEDTEYSLLLLEKGVRIRFAAEVGVFAKQPENLAQAYGQRVRWASGNAAIAKSRALRYIFSGILKGSGTLLDVGVTLLVGSKPLLLFANVLLAVLAILLDSCFAMIWVTALLMGQVFYICFGIILNGLSRRTFCFLMLSPLYLAWLCVISLLGFAGVRNKEWVRTSRT